MRCRRLPSPFLAQVFSPPPPFFIFLSQTDTVGTTRSEKAPLPAPAYTPGTSEESDAYYDGEGAGEGEWIGERETKKTPHVISRH